MEKMLQIVGLGIGATLLIHIIGKNTECAKSIGIFVRLIAVISIMIFFIVSIGQVFEVIRTLAIKIKMDEEYLTIILKAIGIAYLAEIGYHLSKDAGEEGIATQIQFAGKVMIFILATPIVLALIQLITDLM